MYDTVLKNKKIRETFEEWEEGEGNMSFIDMLLEEKARFRAEGRAEGRNEGDKCRKKK